MTDITDVVHENARYVVKLRREIALDMPTCITIQGSVFDSYYEVHNKEQQVCEYRSPVLVDCIGFAENSSRILETKPWEWYKTAEAQAVFGNMPEDTVAN